MKKIIWGLIFLITYTFSANAQSTLALQEKCAEGAKKFFFERINAFGGSWGDFESKDGSGSNRFISHYNKKLDKCFIRIDSNFYPKNMDHPIFYTANIFDVFEGKEIASFDSWRFLPLPTEKKDALGFSTTTPSSGLNCQVGNKICNSLSEFETLVRPYMMEE